MTGYLKGALAGAALALTVGFGANADAALFSLSGGTPYTTSNAGANKNDVIGGGFTLLDNAVLTTTAPNVTLSFYLLGAESGYVNLLTTDFGSQAEANGAPPTFPFGFPGTYLFGGTQVAAGVVKTDFTSSGYSGTIGNGAPLLNGLGQEIGSVAFAYLTDLTTFAISATPTNFILFALDDGGAGPDDNHDDYMGVIVATPIPAALPLFLTALAGSGLLARRGRRTV